MKNFLLAITAIFFVFNSNTFAQDLNNTWQFETIQNSAGEQLFSINKNADALELKDGEFSYSLEAKNNLKASGDSQNEMNEHSNREESEHSTMQQSDMVDHSMHGVKSHD